MTPRRVPRSLPALYCSCPIQKLNESNKGAKLLSDLAYDQGHRLMVIKFSLAIGGAGIFKRTKVCDRLAPCLRPDPTPSLDIRGIHGRKISIRFWCGYGDMGGQYSRSSVQA